jgi:putative methionine-R-sulfoxide reductase with GAF domain
MSKFDLRDIAERLSGSKDTEAVVSEFLGYLQRLRPDWKASLAFYEVSTDSLVRIYRRTLMRLESQPVQIPVDGLPPRLVRKFFHPSAFFNQPSRRSLISALFQTSPYHELDPVEAPTLAKVAPIPHWQSCICLPLADREDIMALVVMASEKRGAFPSRLVAEILPVKSMAALALSQQLYRAQHPVRVQDPRTAPQATAAFQEHIRKLHQQAEALNESNQEKERRLEDLSRQIESLDKNSSEYRRELERVKTQLVALEDQASAATDQLNQAYTQLTTTQQKLLETQRTVGFVKEVFQLLSQEYEDQEFGGTLVAWFCEHMGVERCSLMTLDHSREVMRITAQQGIDPEVAGRVKVRLGQGISGWVAHNRKPLLVQFRDEVDGVAHTDQDQYNSDSFVCVPLIHNNRVLGVLNLSNKRGGEQFDEVDLERAQIAGSILAVTLDQRSTHRAAAVWT